LTREIAEKLGADVIQHRHNLGYGATLSSLFSRARERGADIVVTFDGDGQHDARFLSHLVAPIIGGEADLVIGSRFMTESPDHTPLWRKFGIRIINSLVTRVSGRRYSDTQSGMRAYNAKILKVVDPSENGMGASAEILLRASSEGLRIKEVGIQVVYENARSTQNPALQWIDVIGTILKQASIRHPLKFYGVPGSIFILAGLVFGAWTLAGYQSSGRVTTNLAIVSIGSLIIGLIFSVTAIMMFSLVSLIRERVQT
jgi:glycosyltransferase involved in cell wall biosynthesis